MGKYYRENQGEDISKILTLDNREKKRIGSNIFSRASTRKGGKNQPLRTQYYYMSRKERNKLNGEVLTINMNNLLTFKELETKDIELQRALMEHWRSKYKIKDIIEALEINDGRYYEKLQELGIERKRIFRRHTEVSQQELEKMKNDLVDYDTLMSIPPYQRYEILPIYFNSFETRELSKAWGVDDQRVYTIKNQMKNYLSSKNANSESDDLDDNSIEQEKISEKNSEKIYKKIDNLSNIMYPTSIDNNEKKNIDNESFFFSVKQNGNSESIIKKLNMLINLMDDNEEYELSLTVKQK